jgi:hypothetical protein
MTPADEFQVPVHIVPLGLRESGRTDGNEVGLGACADVEDSLLDVVISAHDGGRLVHGRRLQRDRFAEMAHQQHQSERRAALRPVHDRHAPIHAEERVTRAQRLAHLEWIDHCRLD